MCGRDYVEVARFDSMKDAAEQTGIPYSSIYAVVRKGKGCAQKFHFYWTDEWEENGCKPPKEVFETERVPRTHNKKSVLGRIVQLNRKYEVVETYEDINVAAEATGLRYSSIYAAAKKGKDAFAGMFHWRFEDDMGADTEGECSADIAEAPDAPSDSLLDADW